MKPRPWAEYGLRAFTSLAFLFTAYGLLTTSTFAVRMRKDFPAQLLTWHGADAVALALALALALAPLAFGKRYLSALLVSSFLVSGIYAYWWTTVPWDDVITDSRFNLGSPALMQDYLLVATPVLLVAAYAAMSRAARLGAELKRRGVDRPEIGPAVAYAFLAGAGAIVTSGALAFALWLALAKGWVLVSHPLQGVPAIVALGVLLVALWGLAALKRPAQKDERSPRRAAGATMRLATFTRVSKRSRS